MHFDIWSCIFMFHFRHRGSLLIASDYETNHRRAAVSSPHSPTMGSRTRETVEAWPWTAATNGRSGFWLLWRTPPQRGKEETSNGFQFQQRRRRWQGENYSLSTQRSAKVFFPGCVTRLWVQEASHAADLCILFMTNLSILLLN